VLADAVSDPYGWDTFASIEGTSALDGCNLRTPAYKLVNRRNDVYDSVVSALCAGRVRPISQPSRKAEEIVTAVVTGMAQLKDVDGREECTAVALALAAQFAIGTRDNSLAIAASVAQAGWPRTHVSRQVSILRNNGIESM
jgi:hypothetical protein